MSVDPTETPRFRYVEELVRHELSSALGGVRGMLEGAAPFVGFTIAWVLSRQLAWALGVAVAVAVLLAGIRLVQRQSLKFVVQAVIPTAIAAVVAARTGRAEDIFLPGILYNGALAVIAAGSVAVRAPLVGFLYGAAIGDPTGWRADRGLVRMTGRLTLVLAVPYVLRFVIQLPLFLLGDIVLLAIAKIVLGWPLLLGALFVVGLLLSKGRTPIEGTGDPDTDPENDLDTADGGLRGLGPIGSDSSATRRDSTRRDSTDPYSREQDPVELDSTQPDPRSRSREA